MSAFFYRNHIVQKRFGQNFLIDQSIIDSIVLAINPQKNQVMVEIGPGFASLTKPIGKILDHLIVIEIDRNLVDLLKINASISKKLTIYQQDAMKVNFGNISKKMGNSLRVFGNLPYNISKALILHLFGYIRFIEDMHFMLQKEVANRLFAKPNSKEYGFLSVISQYHCKIIKLLEVFPNSFRPSPKVDSILVRLIPYIVSPYILKDLRILKLITKEAFKQRRKMIRNSLSSLFNSEMFTEMNIDSKMRAENISVSEYCWMANYYSSYVMLNNSK